MTKPERTETAKLQELIVNILERHPEGLSTDELISVLDYDTYRLRIQQILGQMGAAGTIGRTHPVGGIPSFIPRSELDKLSPVERYIRKHPEPGRFVRGAGEESIGYTIVSRLESRYPRGATTLELINDPVLRKYKLSNIAPYIRKYIGRIVDMTQEKSHAPRRFEVIGAREYAEKIPKKDRKIPIGYLYFDYSRADVPLKKDGMHKTYREDLIRLLEYTKRIGNSTPKDTTFKVRFIDEDNDRVATLVSSNRHPSGMMYEMGTLIPMNEDELIEVVKGAIRK